MKFDTSCVSNLLPSPDSFPPPYFSNLSLVSRSISLIESSPSILVNWCALLTGLPPHPCFDSFSNLELKWSFKIIISDYYNYIHHTHHQIAPLLKMFLASHCSGWNPKFPTRPPRPSTSPPASLPVHAPSHLSLWLCAPASLATGNMPGSGLPLGIPIGPPFLLPDELFLQIIPIHLVKLSTYASPSRKHILTPKLDIRSLCPMSSRSFVC